MKIDYTGQAQEFTAAQQKKLASRWTKIGKLIDRRAESSLHVIFTGQRHLTKAELTLRHAGQDVVAKASGTEPFEVLLNAADTLEQLILKLHAKRRDTRRVPADPAAIAPPAAGKPLARKAPYRKASREASPEVKRVAVAKRLRPMTAEEAVLAIGDDRAYLPFEDADTGAISVLIRRENGRFDLLET